MGLKTATDTEQALTIAALAWLVSPDGGRRSREQVADAVGVGARSVYRWLPRGGSPTRAPQSGAVRRAVQNHAKDLGWRSATAQERSATAQGADNGKDLDEQDAAQDG